MGVLNRRHSKGPSVNLRAVSISGHLAVTASLSGVIVSRSLPVSRPESFVTARMGYGRVESLRTSCGVAMLIVAVVSDVGGAGLSRR